MKRFIILLLLALGGYSAYLATLDETALPPLLDGDIIFQSTWTNQSMAIGLATASVYIHVGIIEKTGKGLYIVDAANPVRETPLIPWLHNGVLRRFAVYRYRGLTPEQGKRIVAEAVSHDGEPYNFYFSFEKGSMYCSELVYQAYKDAGIPLGKVEKIGELHINNRFTKEIIEQRWRNYPGCRGQEMSFEQCYAHIMDGDIITPASLADDSHLTRIFNNYPW